MTYASQRLAPGLILSVRLSESKSMADFTRISYSVNRGSLAISVMDLFTASTEEPQLFGYIMTGFVLFCFIVSDAFGSQGFALDPGIYHVNSR